MRTVAHVRRPPNADATPRGAGRVRPGEGTSGGGVGGFLERTVLLQASVGRRGGGAGHRGLQEVPSLVPIRASGEGSTEGCGNCSALAPVGASGEGSTEECRKCSALAPMRASGELATAGCRKCSAVVPVRASGEGANRRL